MNKLTEEEKRVILHKGTEAPFSGEYVNTTEKGIKPIFKHEFEQQFHGDIILNENLLCFLPLNSGIPLNHTSSKVYNNRKHP